eukprot:TRINITY_DN23886_c0_g2_i1.p1 TRINITY_DN23886_c0_g2~~TRINITY_DN23886_c0_g2_i1.p1  ORF type:complete len:108 (+),score=16.65 TRINITY_DN23886_c0_g2_i1:439-762(+)
MLDPQSQGLGRIMETIKKVTTAFYNPVGDKVSMKWNSSLIIVVRDAISQGYLLYLLRAAQLAQSKWAKGRCSSPWIMETMEKVTTAFCNPVGQSINEVELYSLYIVV